MHRAYLEFREGTSDKFYRIIAIENNGQWITTVWWGRRGSTGQTQLKYEGPSEAQALACLEDIARQKRAKGYTDALDPLQPAAPSAPANTAKGVYRGAVALPSPAPSQPGVPRFPAMKAKEVDVDWSSMGGYVMEEKFDGHRAGLTFQPDGSIEIRNVYGENKGKIENTPHIKAHLQEVFDRSKYDLYEGTLIDGELVGLTLQETTHLLGGGGRTDPRLRFVAFDLPYLAGADMREAEWATRRNLLEELLLGISAGPVEIALTRTPSQADVQGIWARGGEGAILKPVASRYVPGGRSDWIKIKEHHTAEAVVTDFEYGNGKYNNQVGALVLSQYKNGLLTEVTKVSGMTDADRRDMTTNWAAWENHVIEFEYQTKTADSYRHPRYVRPRPDKKPADCTWEASA